MGTLARCARPACVAAVVLCAVGVAAGDFHGLGGLDAAELYSKAQDVSADGRVVVGYARAGADAHFEAFRWTAGDGTVSLGVLPGGTSSKAYAVSGDGGVIVGRGEDADGAAGFVWRRGEGMSGLDGFYQASGVSGDGSVVVGRSPTPQEAMRWTAAGGTVRLGGLDPDDVYSNAASVSADGAVVVGHTRNTDAWFEAFRWTARDGMHPLGDLPGGGRASHALGCSGDGAVVVGRSQSAHFYEAFRWTADGGMVPLGVLPGGARSEAYDCSADGSVVVGMSTTAGGAESRAFLWTADGGMRPLADVLAAEGVDLTGWTLIEATAVSADGEVVVGSGVNPAGRTEAWRATLPSPTAAALLTLAAPVLLRRRRLCRDGVAPRAVPPQGATLRGGRTNKVRRIAARRTARRVVP